MHPHPSAYTGAGYTGYPIFNEQPLDNQAPVRVEKAMNFLALCMVKTQPRAAINDISIEWADEIKLTDEEAGAHATACNLLSQYFAGKLSPNEQEQARLMAFRSKQAAERATGGVMMLCSACDGEAGRGACELCRGSGRIIVRPGA